MRSSVDVHNLLQEKEIQHELVTLSGSVKNSARMAEILGLEPHSIIKTLVWLAGGDPILAIVAGDCKVDSRKLKKVIGTEQLRFANDDEVSDITGYLMGAIPPCGWRTKTTVYVDSLVLKNDIVYAAGGQVNIVLKIRAADLIAATGATVADIAE